MKQWRDMKSMPIGDQRNIVVEVRGAPQSQALAYWTGRIWAFAPISDKPVDIGFNPVEYRMPVEQAAPGSDQFTDVRNELGGRRWTFEEAATLIEMIRQGTAHLPTPPSGPAPTDLRHSVSAGTHDALDLLDFGRACRAFVLDLETSLEDARSALRTIRPGSTLLHDRQACLRAVAVLLDRVDTIDALTERAHVGKVSL